MKRGAMEQPARLASLSNDCLAAILALVPLAQRVASCALVCKRWHGLVTTEPRLLQSLVLELSNCSSSRRSRSDPAADAELSLRSLLRFLSAAAPHVRQLTLSLDAPRHYGAGQARMLAAELQACLGRCTGLGCLSLDLCDVPCPLGPWLAPLAGSLRQLQVEYMASSILRGDEGTLRLQPGGLAVCTQLEDLVLKGDSLLDACSAGCWPQGLSSLELHRPFARELPASIAALGSVRRLRVAKFEGRPAAWQPLSQLTALTGLELERCKYLPDPACLAALTGLQSLELLSSPADHEFEIGLDDSDEEEDDFAMLSVDEVEEALAALGGRQLTHLRLTGCDYLTSLPSSISRFSSLRSFTFDSDPNLLLDVGWRCTKLPPGGWHLNLTRLELPHTIVGAPAVLQALQAATQLEELTVGRLKLPPRQPLPEALQFVSWAAGRPRLRRLTVGLCEGWSEVPFGMPTKYSITRSRGDSSSMIVEPAGHMLRRQAVAAMGALATAALQVQARRPVLAIRIVSDAELHPGEQDGDWVPYTY